MTTVLIAVTWVSSMLIVDIDRLLGTIVIPEDLPVILFTEFRINSPLL